MAEMCMKRAGRAEAQWPASRPEIRPCRPGCVSIRTRWRTSGLEPLYRQVAGLGCVVLLTDARGVMASEA